MKTYKTQRNIFLGVAILGMILLIIPFFVQSLDERVGAAGGMLFAVGIARVLMLRRTRGTPERMKQFEIQQKDVFAEYKWHKLNLRIDIAYINVDELVDAKIFPTRLGDNEYVQYQTFCHTCVNNTGVWAIPAKRVDFDFTVDWEYDEKNDGCKYKFRKKTGKVM